MQYIVHLSKMVMVPLESLLYVTLPYGMLYRAVHIRVDHFKSVVK